MAIYRHGTDVESTPGRSAQPRTMHSWYGPHEPQTPRTLQVCYAAWATGTPRRLLGELDAKHTLT
eukprot:scaffold104593_cov69-Phaeocystis_antarctica.AAC.1